MYSMQYLSTLGSDPWVPVISCRPVAYGWWVEARPSHKSHLSKCDFHLPLKGPVPVRPLHQPVSVTQGWSVKSKPSACLSASATCFLPPSPCHSSATTSRVTCLLTSPSLPSLPSLLPFFPERLPSKAPPALHRVRESDRGPACNDCHVRLDLLLSLSPSLELPAAPHGTTRLTVIHSQQIKLPRLPFHARP